MPDANVQNARLLIDEKLYNPMPETLKLQSPKTLNPESKKTQPKTPNPKLQTLHPKPWTFKPQ